MGFIHADIEIINAGDLALARHGSLKKEEVRSIFVRSIVSKIASTLCINEMIAQQLGLPFQEKRLSELADGTRMKLDLVGPVKIKFKNRTAHCTALVLPGDSEVLLGAIPLEDMDVLIDPSRQELALPDDRPYLALVKVK